MAYPTDAEKTELRGSVEDITFRNDENGFTVLELNVSGDLQTVVGVLPAVAPGEELRLMGRWDFHPSFGRQFKAELCERKMPSTAADLLHYLSSGAIKGVGPATAVKIVEMFGEDAFDVLENHPNRLARVRGISPGKAMEICQRFKEQFAVREVMIALERFGMTASECIRVFRLFGSNAVEKVTADPYCLCEENIGISFERADAIASAMQDSPNEKLRTMAGVVHAVRHNLSNGHTCLPREKLYTPCAELLHTSAQTVSEAVDALVECGRLVEQKMNGKAFVFLPRVFEAERSAADHMLMKLQFPPAVRSTLMEEICMAEEKESVTYADKQREAIRIAAERGLLILTGGPGTGKTTALKGILRLYEEQGLDVALAAPTGRAAKRMSEVTGREAKTLHRLLEVEWDESDHPQFQRNERNPIDANALIVDELSMVDIYVFSSLLKALPFGCRLVLVGDADQLPPVGAGNVLHDLIESGKLPVVRLTEVFRQAQESLIVTNAHRIVRGEMPVLNENKKDFFFMNRSPRAAAATVCSLYTERLPRAYHYSPLEDIQVLCPSRKGETGAVHLNQMLQQMLNPPDENKNEIRIKGNVLRVGDKVMQVRNNYDIVWSRGAEDGVGVYNGDIGVLTGIDLGNGELELLFDGRTALYTLEDAQDLELAYAITVHKSQGSEFPAVIVPVAGVVPQLRYRNLLYTAVTRAKNILILVGGAGEVREMTENDRKARRYSALQYFLTNDEPRSF